MKGNIYLALVHYPVINKRGCIITSSITNLDLHDIARICRTYGVKRYYIIQPLQDQKELIKELLAYWQNAHGRLYNPDRHEALKLLKVVSSLEELETKLDKKGPILWVGTEARRGKENLSYKEARKMLSKGKDMLILFGTAWGLAPQVLERCDYVLEPIEGRVDKYNHLSVRSAAAIIIDRLLGESWWKG